MNAFPSFTPDYRWAILQHVADRGNDGSVGRKGSLMNRGWIMGNTADDSTLRDFKKAEEFYPSTALLHCAMICHQFHTGRNFKMTMLCNSRMRMAMCPPGGGRPALSV